MVLIGSVPANVLKLAAIAAVVTTFSSSLLAVEGAFGRTVPGLWIYPRAGVVGPEPGFSFSILPVGYRGSMSGKGGGPGLRDAPTVTAAGLLLPDIDIDGNSNYFVPRYVYRTETRKVSFASSCRVRITWAAVSAAFGGQQVRFTDTGFSDFIFAPLTVGVHFSPTNNLAIGTMIFAPTASFREGNLANLGVGAWTVMPNVGHTYVWRKAGLELDNFLGFDIYSRNNTTNYRNGVVFHWDGMLLKYLASNRFGAGALVGNLTQINDDSGALADRLKGFRGGAWGAGPIVLYVARLEKPGVILQFRAVPEFAVTNLTQGTTLLMGITLKWD